MRRMQRDVGVSVVLAAAALALRLAHILAIHDTPWFRLLFLDLRYYDEWGWRIAQGHLLGDGAFFQDPAYPYFLGLVYAVFGHEYLPVVLVQAALGSLVPVLLFLAAREWLGRAAALTAGVLAALYAPAIYYEGLVLKTWLSCFAVALALWLMGRALRDERPGWWAGAGVAIALAALSRGNLVLAVPVLAAWLAIDGRRFRSAAAFLLGASVLLGASAARNRVVTGSWILTTANAGQNLYIGNNPLNTDGRYARLPFVDPTPRDEQRDFAREAERRTGRTLTPAEVSRFWAGQAWSWIRGHPGDWLRLTVSKIRLFAGAWEVPDSRDFYVYRELSWALRLPLPAFGLVFPFAVIGAVSSLRRPGWPRALLVLLATYVATVVVFFVFGRFRMAVAPVLLVLAGTGMTDLGREIASAARRRRVPAVLLARLSVLAVLLAIVWLPVRGPRTLWTVRLAERVGLPVRVETAAEAHFNLGVTFAEQGGLDEAERELRLAAAARPEHGRIDVELGKVLARAGRDVEAIAAYERGLEEDPGDPRAWTGLGILYRRNGSLEQAESAFRTSLGLRPRSVATWTFLGEILLELGRKREAAESFRAALAHDPAFERASAGLRRALGDGR